MKEQVLRRVLWGNYYFDPKTKQVFGQSKGRERGLSVMFVKFVLDNIWAVYKSVLDG